MKKHEELFQALIQEQINEKAKVLGSKITWFTWPTPGQVNSTEPYITVPNGTFQPAEAEDSLPPINESFLRKCPECGSPTAIMEKRIGGYSFCGNNHKYLHTDSVQ